MPRPGKPTDVLVVGGSGKMGQWFVRFLTERGHKVKVFDPDTPPKEKCRGKPQRRSKKEAGIIIVATPISAAKEVLEQVVALKPKGTVFDINSSSRRSSRP